MLKGGLRKMKTKCRHCKKDFKFNGNAYGFCSAQCRKERLNNCSESPISFRFVKAIQFPICDKCGKRHYRKAGKPCEFIGDSQ
jgi:hypothetical protein